MVKLHYFLNTKTWTNELHSIIETTTSPSGLAHGYTPLAMYNGECFEVIGNNARFRKKISKAMQSLNLTCKLGKYYVTL